MKTSEKCTKKMGFGLINAYLTSAMFLFPLTTLADEMLSAGNGYNELEVDLLVRKGFIQRTGLKNPFDQVDVSMFSSPTFLIVTVISTLW